MTTGFNADWQYHCPECGGDMGVRKTRPGRMPARLYHCLYTLGCDGLPVRTATPPEVVHYLYLEPAADELLQLEPWQAATVRSQGYLLQEVVPCEVQPA